MTRLSTSSQLLKFLSPSNTASCGQGFDAGFLGTLQIQTVAGMKLPILMKIIIPTVPQVVFSSTMIS